MKRQTTAVRLLSVLAAAFLLLTGAGCAANAGGGPVVKETPAYEFEGWGKNPPAFDRGGGVDAMRSVAKDGTLELFIDDTWERGLMSGSVRAGGGLSCWSERCA